MEQLSLFRFENLLATTFKCMLFYAPSFPSSEATLLCVLLHVTCVTIVKYQHFTKCSIQVNDDDIISGRA